MKTINLIAISIIAVFLSFVYNGNILGNDQPSGKDCCTTECGDGSCCTEGKSAGEANHDCCTDDCRSDECLQNCKENTKSSLENINASGNNNVTLSICTDKGKDCCK